MNKSIKRIEMDNQQAKRTERHLKKQKNICVLAEINLSDSMSRLLVYAKDPHNPTVGVLRLVNSNTNQSE